MISMTRKLISIHNKFALWIDLRTYPDNYIHGSGLYIDMLLVMGSNFGN